MRQFDNLATPGASLRAADLNELHKEIKRNNQLSVEGGNLTQGPSGPTITVDKGQSFYAAITAVGTNGFHSWEERRIDLKGGWLIPPNPRRGGWNGEAAKEINGGSATVGAVVKLDPAGNYTSASGRKEKLWIFSSGAKQQNTIIWIKPWRWAWVPYIVNGSVSSYARCVIWAESDPDIYDVPVYTEGWIFDCKTGFTYANDNIDNSERSSLFYVYGVDQKKYITSGDIEFLPSSMWAETGQAILIKPDDFSPLSDNNYGDYKFVRRFKFNKDGTNSTATLLYSKTGFLKQLTSFRSYGWFAVDYSGTEISPYVPNQNFRYSIAKELNYYSYSNNRYGTFKIITFDAFGLGFPRNYGSSYAYLFQIVARGNIYTNGYFYVPIQVFHFTSPLYVAPTTTVGGSIGTGLSGSSGTSGTTSGGGGPVAPAA
jgi:hypothetical protein